MGLRILVRNAPLIGAQILAACICIALGTARVHAQKNAEEIVTKLNSDALDAFNQLDINKAGAMLEEALRVSAQGGVSPGLIARTNLNMGIIYVSGLSDHDGALPFFVAAICADPQIQLDPLTSTPEVQSVYAVALQKAQGGACPAQGGAGSGQPAAPIAPVRPPPEQALIHHSPPEQLAQTPLPLYAEVHALAGAKKIMLFYKGIGMEQFKPVPMYQYQGGFAYQISCNDVWEPRIAYYIEAHDEAGAVVGVAGSAAQPIEVPIVTARTQAEPALPQAAAPASCAASECPPGVKGCRKSGTAGIDEACESDSDCQSGLECTDESVCRLIGSGSTEVPDYDESTGTFEDFDEPEGEVEPKRFFIQLGFTMGFSYLMQGMEADRPAPQDRVFMAQSGMGAGMLTGNAPAIVAGGGGVVFPEPGTASEANLTAWIPDSDSEDSIGALQNECPADGTRTGPSVYAGTGNPADLFPSSYCVRMRSTGFVPQTALRANIGYFFTPRIAASALFRMQFSAGEGSFAGILLGARGEYLLTEPQTKGFTASAFLGVTFGQIQAQPPADGSTDEAPFVVTGPLGVHIGSTLRYRFMPNFGVFVAPELDMQLPAVLFHVDGTLGLEAAF